MTKNHKLYLPIKKNSAVKVRLTIGFQPPSKQLKTISSF
ncbi:hypothetical protein NBRC111894_953 [Sporolactobacillus inulinus]|uniref:Uncharacterized protein n=1 Tax=Sporolactobacillus inulinus TaxID=2078 RepID=A0A4Y1Z8M9_9BACL|nr:hypothetical protein NBRC111894_953 [Sporolactobacillus inulinus]